jgi:predicted anti-sigma-YlaC factor YlaD
MKLMLDCRALARLLSQSQDDVPPLTMRARMRLHLVTCQACRSVDEQLHFVRTAMHQLQIKPLGDQPAARQLH